MIDNSQEQNNDKPNFAELLSRLQQTQENIIIQSNTGDLWSVSPEIIDDILSGELALRREYLTLQKVERIYGIVIKFPFILKPLTIICKKNRNYPLKRFSYKFYIVKDAQTHLMSTQLTSITEMEDEEAIIADDSSGKMANFVIKKRLIDAYRKMFMSKE